MPPLSAAGAVLQPVGRDVANPSPFATPELFFGEFPITELGQFPPPPDSQCWVYLTLNSEIALSIQGNETLRSLVLQPRVRVSIDGQWIWWALRRKYPGRSFDKLSGSDLIYRLARHCAASGQTLLLLGSYQESNADAVAELRRRHPGLCVVGHAPPRYQIGTSEEQAAWAGAMQVFRLCRPDYVVLGLGAAKEQRLCAALAPELDGMTTGLLCFGGAIDLASGHLHRAPVLLQRCGLESVFRVLQQPSRIGRFLRFQRILPALIRGRY